MHSNKIVDEWLKRKFVGDGPACQAAGPKDTRKALKAAESECSIYLFGTPRQLGSIGRTPRTGHSAEKKE